MSSYPDVTIDVNGLCERDTAKLRSFQDFVTRSIYTLDQLDTMIRAAFPHDFVYRGGNHISLHAADGSPRVMLVCVRDVHPVPRRTKK